MRPGRVGGSSVGLSERVSSCAEGLCPCERAHISALVGALGWIGPVGAVGMMLIGLAVVGTNGLRMHEGGSGSD